MTVPGPVLTSVRQDPALSLLDQVMRDALDPGYAEAARDPRVRRGRLAVAVVLGLLAFVVVALVLEIRQEAPAAAEARAALVDRIGQATEGTDALEAELAELRAEVETLQAQALAAVGAGQTLVTTVENLGVAAGTRPVVGPGVEVVLDDAGPDDVPDDVDAELSRVIDQDLQLAANGLWAAGAEAVAINGQRLTSLTAIRSAGDAILVNYRPLTRPYVVRAIGPPSLGVDFADAEAGRTLRTLQQTYGIGYDLEDVDEMRLPGAAVGELDEVSEIPDGGAGR